MVSLLSASMSGTDYEGDSKYPLAITLFRASVLMNAALVGRWKEGRLRLEHLGGVVGVSGSSWEIMGILRGDFLMGGAFGDGVGVGNGIGVGLGEGKW